ncbi:MAG: hypothetical protein H6732_15925 [Alphaproteobacteria bacterium]|nr:hypothetical protein [Alphaproteobacteria bacterium]
MPQSRLAPLLAFVPVLGLVACGPPESEFVPEYNRLWCAHQWECLDKAQLTFDGVKSAEECEEKSIAGLADWGNGCVYSSSAAAECLIDLAALTCPAQEGALASQPITCTAVYLDCADAGDTDAGDTSDSGDAPKDSGEEPADTDPSDTDAS